VISVIPGQWKERDRGSFFGGADQAKPVFIVVMGADDAETEASETSERERPAIDFEAELRARAVGTRHFGAAAAEQDDGIDVLAAGAGGGDFQLAATTGAR
jgi:hypothetical protein